MAGETRISMVSMDAGQDRACMVLLQGPGISLVISKGHTCCNKRSHIIHVTRPSINLMYVDFEFRGPPKVVGQTRGLEDLDRVEG